MAVNAIVARGLIPVMYRNGAPYAGASRTYYVPSSYGTALYVGDPVIIVTASAESIGIPTVGIATAGGGAFMIGSVTNIGQAGDPIVPMTRDQPVYHPASTAGYVQVADDPFLLFEIQENGSGGAMGIGAAGRNADLVAGSGSTVTGFSGWQLASNTLATTSTLQLRILYPVVRADNDPTTTNAKWLVAINNHAMTRTTGV
jgi:hypothetical protein